MESEFEMKMIQDGFDLKYIEELKLFNKRKEVYRENRPKAYAPIMGYCRKVMGNPVLKPKEINVI